ncbi:hypothetical protein AO391_24825 [Pseudomonas marginalis ICMP 9505]|nr:hypothetical protein AO391_24825 [Pseudomonas marginalis ICMP 9505]
MVEKSVNTTQHSGQFLKAAENYRLLGELLSKIADTDLILDPAFQNQIAVLQEAMADHLVKIRALRVALDASELSTLPKRAQLRLVKR